MSGERVIDVASALITNDELECAIALELIAQSAELRQSVIKKLGISVAAPVSAENELLAALNPDDRDFISINHLALLVVEEKQEWSLVEQSLIERNLSDTSALHREHACLVLSNSNIHSGMFKHPLLELLQDRDRYVRAAALFALRNVFDDSFFSTFTNLKSDRFTRLIIESRKV